MLQPLQMLHEALTALHVMAADGLISLLLCIALRMIGHALCFNCSAPWSTAVTWWVPKHEAITAPLEMVLTGDSRMSRGPSTQKNSQIITKLEALIKK